MADNSSLHKAKKAKNDEFYTQYKDIEKEISCYPQDTWKGKVIYLNCDNPSFSNFWKYFVDNFHKLGLKALHATYKTFDNSSSWHWIFDGKTALKQPLKGNGDFRSEECIEILKEADIIVTNPPFSLFKEFLALLVENNKKFLLITNKNCVTYKETFPLIKANKLWSGGTKWSGGMWFVSPNEKAVDKIVDGVPLKNIPSIWLTNLEYERRHTPLKLMTMADNLKCSKHLKIREMGSYQQYDNYDALEVSYTDAIPSDYDGAMGVPISFLEKYCPEQFEILGASDNGAVDDKYKLPYHGKPNVPYLKGNTVYKRLFIKHRKLC